MARKVEINAEYSAQRTAAKPNPMLLRVLEHLADSFEGLEGWRVADQGCGKLRNFEALSQVFNDVTLIDTREQLSKTQMIFKDQTSIEDWVRDRSGAETRVSCYDATTFSELSLGLDLIVCVAVLDVVPPRVRTNIIESAFNNLKKGGIYALVVPRNDQSITKRCTEENRYADGHVFHHHGVTTFYKNFRSLDSITRRLRTVGFHGIDDGLSIYRQGCVIAKA